MGKPLSCVSTNVWLGCAATAVVLHYLWRMQQQQQNQQARNREDTVQQPKNAASRGLRAPLKDTLQSSSALPPSSSGSAASSAASESSSSSSFLTHLVAQLWDHINVAVSKEIRQAVEPILQSSLPGPLKNIRFTRVSLGSVPIRFENFRIRDKEILLPREDETSGNDSGDGDDYTSDAAVIQFDMDLVWEGQCDMSLQADYVGSVGVRSMQIAGRLNFVLKPVVNQMPIVQAVQCAFVNPPTVALNFTGLANVAEFAVIHKTVMDMICNSIQNVMVLPQRLPIKLDPTVTIVDMYTPPLGILRVTLLSGHNFQEEPATWLSPRSDVPDVYCQLSLGGGTTFKSHTIQDSFEPVWNETFDFVVFDYNQELCIEAWDEDYGVNSLVDPDDKLGSIRIPVSELLQRQQQQLQLELLTDDRAPTGAFVTIQCHACKFTTTSLDKLQSCLTTSNSKRESSQPPSSIPSLFSSLAASGKNIKKKNNPNNKDADDYPKHLMCGLLTIFVIRAIHVPVVVTSATSTETPDAAAAAAATSHVQVTVLNQCYTTPAVATSSTDGSGGEGTVYDAVFSIPLTTEASIQLLAATDDKEPSLSLVTFRLLAGEPVEGAKAAAATSSERSLGTATVSWTQLWEAQSHKLVETLVLGTTGGNYDGSPKLEIVVQLQGIQQDKVQGDTSPSAPETIALHNNKSVPVDHQDTIRRGPWSWFGKSKNM